MTKENSKQLLNGSRESEKRLEFDDLLSNYVGEFGRYQKFVLAVLCYSWIISGFVALNPVFIAGVPDHWCDIQGNSSIFQQCSASEIKSNLLPQEKRDGRVQQSQCERYDFGLDSFPGCNETFNHTILTTSECDKWQYDDSVYGSSNLVTEWDLVCSKLWWVSNINGVHWIGKVVGLLIWGHLGDRFGRRVPTVIGSLLFYASTIAMIFAPNYWVFLVAKFFAAIFLCGRDITATVACMEPMGISWRVFVMVVGNGAWASSYVILAGIAYLERRWRHVLMWITLPDLLVPILFMFVLDESPRWLLANGRDSEAWQIIRKMCKWNRTAIPENVVPYVKREDAGVSAIQLVKTRSIRLCTIAQSFIWFLTCFVYYGIILNMGSFGDNVYLNFIIGGLIELPAMAVMIWCYKKCGRVVSLGVSVFAAGIVLFISFFLPEGNQLLLTSCALVGKLFVTITFTGLWIYTLEVYPTSIRNIGISTMSSVSRFGSFIASYIGTLATVNRALPLVIFGISALSAGVATSVLPETRNQSMKQTVEEGEIFMKDNMYKAYPCFRCRKNRDRSTVIPLNDGEKI